MVDKDQAEINAIRKVFNESHVLLCWYHVTQVSTKLSLNGGCFVFSHFAL